MALKPIMVFVTVFATATASIQPAAAWSSGGHSSVPSGPRCKTGVNISKNINIYKPAEVVPEITYLPVSAPTMASATVASR